MSSSSTGAAAAAAGAVDKNKIRIAIVGFGTCALEVLVIMRKNPRFDVVLIEPRDVVYYKLGAPRALVSDLYLTKNDPFWSIASLLSPNVRHEQARATRISIDEKTIFCDNGHEIRFDYCIVATGSAQPAVGNEASLSSKAEIIARLREIQALIANADDICCVGGGFVGSEVAYEIAAAFPQKHVTVVHSGPLIGKASASAAAAVLDDEPCDKFFNKLTKQAQTEFPNVTLLLNDRITKPDGFTGQIDTTARNYTSQSGAAIKADLTIWCVGEQIINPFRDSFDCNERGQIQINKHLQAVGRGDVFCIGDVASKEIIKEANRLYYGAQWAGVIVANILSLVDNGQCNATYKPPTKYMFATLGPKVGTAEMPIGVVGSLITRNLKGGDLFLGRTKSRLGVK